MKAMKKVIVIILILILASILIYLISHNKPANKNTYKSITMDEAKEIFKESGDYIILDVRRDDEYSQGHIPGAINVANEDINNEPVPELPDLDQTIYVYCRSGRRSKEASQKLAEIGYTNIIEFGGIIDWTGEIE